jgi:hypothetical protein
MLLVVTMFLAGLSAVRPASAAVPQIEDYRIDLVFARDHEPDATLIIDSQDAAGNFKGSIEWSSAPGDQPVSGVISEPRTGYFRMSFTVKSVLGSMTFEGAFRKESSRTLFMAGSFTNSYWDFRPGQRPRYVVEGPLPFCATGIELIP